MATDGQDENPEPWQALYTAALQVPSVDELPERIRTAEEEIANELARPREFQTNDQLLLDALSALRDLEIISQAFPMYASGKS